MSRIASRARHHSPQNVKAFISLLASEAQAHGRGEYRPSKSESKLLSICRIRVEILKSSDDKLFRKLAIKDNIATSDFGTTCGSGILLEYQSPFEATVVAKLRQRHADYTTIGKTNMDEFGMGSHSLNSYFGPVRHHRLQAYSAGGSSGGSAVAVATNVCEIALGTDTGGSVRLPAAYTGVVGFKPSYGLVSRHGVIPYANSLDTVGFFARKVAQVIDAFQVTSVPDKRDPTSLKRRTRQRIKNTIHLSAQSPSFPEGLRIGIPMEYNIEELEPSIRQAWIASLNLLQRLGCIMVPISLPNTKHALSAYYVIAAAEAASNLSKYDGVRYGTRKVTRDGIEGTLYSDTRGQGFGGEVKRRILLGSYTLSSKAIDNYFIQAQKVRRLVQKDFGRVFRIPNLLQPPQQFDLSDMDPSIKMQDKLGPLEVDFIVCPTAPTFPPKREDVEKATPVARYMNDIFTVPASLAGIPAISIPVRVPGRPPAGLQIIGQYADDMGLLRFAKFAQHKLSDKLAQGKTSREQLDVATWPYWDGDSIPPLSSSTDEEPATEAERHPFKIVRQVISNRPRVHRVYL